MIVIRRASVTVEMTEDEATDLALDLEDLNIFLKDQDTFNGLPRTLEAFYSALSDR